MTEAKMVVYTGTSDVREIGKLRWDSSNNWAVKQADVPKDVMEEMKSGSLKSEFKLDVSASDVEDSGVTESVE